MADIYHGLRKVRNGWEIDLQLDRVSQLLSSGTPLPLPCHSFNPDIIEYAKDLIREIPANARTTFVLWLPKEEIVPGLDPMITGAYGTLLRELVRRQKRTASDELKESLTALAYGTVFMLFCQVLRYFVHFDSPMLQSSFSEGMLVLGWVALWRPFEMLLFSWWPAWQKIKLIRRMGRVGIEIRERRPEHNFWKQVSDPPLPAKQGDAPKA